MSTTLPVTSTLATIKNGFAAVGPASNFATVKLTADTAVLSNRLSALDQEERLTYTARPIQNITTSLQIRNPAPVKSGVIYTITLEETVRTTDGTSVVDEPLVMQLSVRHPRSGNITTELCQSVLARLLGCVLLPANLVTDTVINLGASGTRTRFGDLARLAEFPTIDALASGTADS